MVYRNWKQAKGKIHDAQLKNTKSRRNHRTKNEIKSANKDEKELKRKRKRLTLDWFFKPKGD